MKHRRKIYLSVAVVLLSVAAFFWYRQPSLKVTPDNVMKLKYGMTAEQVIDLLGPSLDMNVYRLDNRETYQEGFESFVAQRYRLWSPDRPDLASYRVLHPCKDNTAFDTTPLLSTHIFIGKDFGVFVTISPGNKLFRAFVYPIISKGVDTLASLEYHFDKLVGNFRAPANAPIPVLAPPPLPPDFGKNSLPGQDVPRPVTDLPAPKK